MRPLTFTEKALARAAGVEAVQAGEVIEVRPDWVLSHDNTAAIARIFHEQLGARRVCCPERLCVFLDHAAPPPTPRHARNHAEVRAFVRAQGVAHFYEVGRGVCHQVLAEEGLVLPGQVILGADSHTTHHGWLGAFGAGIGRTEVAALWQRGRLWLRVPSAIQIGLEGRLPPGVTGKDLALTIIGELGADGGRYRAVEFAGPGVHALPLADRMTLTNMMAEFGVKNAYLPPDEAVFRALEARRPGVDVRAGALYPDPDAPYAARYRLHLERLQPVVACPHRVDRVAPLPAVAGRPVSLAFLGTCTNGRLEDLAAAARVLQGKRVHPATRLIVVPASRQVLQQAMEQGVLQTLVAAGAVIGTPGCGPCMGNHLGIPAPGEVVVSTANRNFRGRMGQPEADIYLASPEVVAASALHGRLTVPESLTPTADSRAGQSPVLVRLDVGEAPAAAPRAAPRPAARSATQRAASRGRAWRYGDHVNTDQIFPGKYTYTLRTPDEIAAHALEDLDPQFASAVQAGDVVFGGHNFGCGSSREQAVTCLKYNGVAAVVARSFARIFYRNAINQGLPAIVCPAAVDAAQPGDPVTVDWARGEIRLPAGRFPFDPFPPHVQRILDAGGLVPYLRQGEETA